MNRLCSLNIELALVKVFITWKTNMYSVLYELEKERADTEITITEFFLGTPVHVGK